jgi:plasmid stabilization system protein ParE
VYLNQQVSGLGGRFLNDLAATFADISQDPESHPVLETLSGGLPFRRALLKVFRYMVVFEVRPDETVVVAVAHTSRVPHYWLDRNQDSGPGPGES